MIRIIRGVYGFINKDGFVIPKTSKDEPFETDADKEARLVKQGVAEYVSDEPEEADEEPEAEPLPVESEEADEEPEAEPLPVEPEEADEEPEKKPAPKKSTKKASKKPEDAEEEPPVISAADPE